MRCFKSHLLSALRVGFCVTWATLVIATDKGFSALTRKTNGPLLGREACTRGPEYWCHNITQAKECNAIKHCISNVWEKIKLPEENENDCRPCRKMVENAREKNFLRPEKLAGLRRDLKTFCNLIISTNRLKTCMKLGDELLSELTDTLGSRMDSQMVCAVSGLCDPKARRIANIFGHEREGRNVLDREARLELHSRRISRAITRVKRGEGDNDSPLCDMCKTAATVLQTIMKIVKDKKDKFDAKIIDAVCTELIPLESLVDVCISVSKSFKKKLWGLLKLGEDPGKICAKIGICGGYSGNSDEYDEEY